MTGGTSSITGPASSPSSDIYSSPAARKKKRATPPGGGELGSCSAERSLRSSAVFPSFSHLDACASGREAFDSKPAGLPDRRPPLQDQTDWLPVEARCATFKAGARART